jgi:hypothetical protein
MLNMARVRLDAPDPDAVYRVFKEFARQSVEGVSAGRPGEVEDDTILYEIGIYGFGEPDKYRIDLVRQFSFFEDGEYDRMEQLHCIVHYEPDEDLRSLGAFNLTTAGSSGWGPAGARRGVAEPFATLDDFLEVIDARPEWETVSGKNAIRLELYQEQV